MIVKKLVDWYRYIMDVVLILLLIAAPVAGGIIGKQLSTYRANYTTTGILLGLAAALVFIFIIMPPVLVLFEINKKLSDKEKIAAKNNNIKEETTTKKAAETSNEKDWVCVYCGEPNAPTDKTCQFCFKSK